MPIARVLDTDGRVAGHVSCNGRIWADDPARPDWKPGATPLHDPAAAVHADQEHPAHLNFSFAEWLKQRTELPRQPSGWTPLSVLYADYVDWCGYTAVPAAYVHSEPEFSGRLQARCDRRPEVKLVERRGLNQTVLNRSTELCFPRHLLPPIRVAA